MNNIRLIFFRKKLVEFNYYNSFFEFNKFFFIRKNVILRNFLLFFDKVFFQNKYFFNWNKVILFSGLGFRKKFFSNEKLYLFYTGDRHWILKTPRFEQNVFLIKKRNTFFFSVFKKLLNFNYSFISNISYSPVYKLKGFLNFRIRRKFLFVRRIKLRRVRLKLSKKQKML